MGRAYCAVRTEYLLTTLLSFFKGLMRSKLVFHFTKVLCVAPLLRGSITKDLILMDCTGPMQTQITAMLRAFIVSIQNTKAEEARHTIINTAGSMSNLSGKGRGRGGEWGVGGGGGHRRYVVDMK